MPGWIISLIIGAGKAIWGLIFPQADPSQQAFKAGQTSAERDDAVAGLQEVQKAKQAGQDERSRLDADPGRLRPGTGAPCANRPYNPDERD